MGICRRHFTAGLLGGMAGTLLEAAPRPKLLVLVVLEQFRPDYLDALTPQLASGGFRRLMEKGAYFPECIHASSTFSATGLTTLSTGAWPAQHGIVADVWYDRTAGRAISPSIEELNATTLAAQVAAEPNARVAVIALNRRHAALFAGTPDARLFWLDEEGQFSTNADPPAWLASVNAQKGAESARNQKWTATGARTDAPPLRTLTWEAERPREFLALYRGSPFAQDAQFEIAANLIAGDNFGKGNGPDLLCIVAGSTAQLGYETGARSPLMQQLALDLDHRLDNLINQLSRSPGEGNFVLAVAAGHGAPPAPSADARARMTVQGEQVAQTIEKALAASGNGHVEKYVYPFLYLNTDGFRDPELLRQAAARAALRHPAVAGYCTAGGACSVQDIWARRFRNSFHVTRSGDVMLSYRPEYVESFGSGRGISYGSLYNYDACVPLFLYGAPFRGGQLENMVEAVDVAPTLARVMGVAPPSSSVGRVLAEALAR